jgi:phosphoribosylaminoimidazole-succinocarboxamide synthase
MTERFLSPSEAARRLGVGVRALRLYERKGLVRPGRTQAGWRVYGPAEIERLHQVLTLKLLGLSLSRITQLLGAREPDLMALLALQEDVLAVRIHDLERARRAVQVARAKLSGEGRLSLEDLIDLVRETAMTKPFIAALKARANEVLADASIPELPNHYRGKVRDNYDLPDGRRIIIASDRISAFDKILAAIPFKGQVLTQTARWWFEQTADICPNHVLAHPDPNVVIGQTLTILPVEIVVRGYLAGTTGTSILTLYNAGQRTIYGHTLAVGMRANQRLPAAIITPTSKAFDGGHDEPLTAEEIIAQELLTADQWETLSRYALALFARGQDLAAERGLILADAKYEFGVDKTGRILLADEIHTPDSSRFWLAESYQQRFDAGDAPESLDKDFVRHWVAARCDPYKDPIPEIPPEVVVETAAVYIQAFETITGQSFEFPPAGAAPLERIRGALAEFF